MALQMANECKIPYFELPGQWHAIDAFRNKNWSLLFQYLAGATIAGINKLDCPSKSLISSKKETELEYIKKYQYLLFSYFYSHYQGNEYRNDLVLIVDAILGYVNLSEDVAPVHQSPFRDPKFSSRINCCCFSYKPADQSMEEIESSEHSYLPLELDSQDPSSKSSGFCCFR